MHQFRAIEVRPLRVRPVSCRWRGSQGQTGWCLSTSQQVRRSGRGLVQGVEKRPASAKPSAMGRLSAQGSRPPTHFHTWRSRRRSIEAGEPSIVEQVATRSSAAGERQVHLAQMARSKQGARTWPPVRAGPRPDPQARTAGADRAHPRLLATCACFSSAETVDRGAAWCWESCT